MPNPANYRRFIFRGGKILQSRELNSVQNMELAIRDRLLRSMWRDGAMFNVELTPNAPDVDLDVKDPSEPMFVHFDGYVEELQPTTISFPAGQTTGFNTVYLNYTVNIATSATDPTLVDQTTGEDVAYAGELVYSFSLADASSAALDPNTQYTKNTTPIILFYADRGGGGSITVRIPERAAVGFLGDDVQKGVVSLTSSGASGVAVAANDLRLTDWRIPAASSVTTLKLKALTSAGPSIYITDPSSGTSTDQIVVTAPASALYARSLTDVLGIIYNQSLNTGLGDHIGRRLGPGVHPMPTWQDVGAAPWSHVGSRLGNHSHPPEVYGPDYFRVLRADAGPAFLVKSTSGYIHYQLDAGGDFFTAILLNTSWAPNARFSEFVAKARAEWGS